MIETRLFTYSMILSITTGIVLVFWHHTIGLGIVFGGLMGSVIFYILSMDIRRLLKSSSKEMLAQARKGYVKRYLLYGVTLTVGILNPELNFFATLIGMMIPRALIIAFTLLGRNTRAV